MKKAVVSFQKNGPILQTTRKEKREQIPGIIERAEMRRCDQIDAEVFLYQLKERRAIRNQKYL